MTTLTFEQYIDQCVAHYRANYRAMLNGSDWSLYRAISGPDICVAMENPNPYKYVAGVEKLQCKTESALIQILHDDARQWPIYADNSNV